MMDVTDVGMSVQLIDGPGRIIVAHVLHHFWSMTPLSEFKSINEARETLNHNIFKHDHDDQPRPITYFLARKWGTGRLRS